MGSSREGAGAKTVLHLAPHPDDELIGAPATLMALRDRGWRVVNLACSLGSGREKRRRRKEVRMACRRAGFELLEANALPVESALAEAVGAVVDDVQPSLLVAPSPHDAHPGHEAVGRAAVAECEARDLRSGTSPRLWLWGLWADLPFPTLALTFDAECLSQILFCLEAHRGELDRNDYRRLVRGRAEMNASLGPERVFGFGCSANDAREYVELLSEAVLEDGDWHLGRRRWLDPDDALDFGAHPLEGPEGVPVGKIPPPAPKSSLGEWLRAP